MIFLFRSFLFFFLIFTPSFVFAITAGPNSPGTMADNTAVGSSVWNNPDNAKVSNDIYASAFTDGGSSHYLQASNLGFSIPVDAIIKGIVVDIESHRGGDPRAVVWSNVRMVKGGTISSTMKSSATDIGTSDSYMSFGADNDLWGESWTYSDINNPDFGVVASANGGDYTWAYVDHIRITVYYTPGVPYTKVHLGNAHLGSGKL